MAIRVIAEIGNNHQGEIDIAKQLIDCAASAGCWAVKSQKRAMREEWAERPYENENSFGKTYLEHREALELSPDQHSELMKYAREKGVEYFVSPWDVISAVEMDSIGMNYFKVASASITDEKLLETIHKTGKPVFLSTGMSTWDEIYCAARILMGNIECIMLCTSTYPCDFSDIRLRRLSPLSLICDLQEDKSMALGFSGHHKGIAVDIAAAALGCKYIERHITLDRTWKGSDHAASLGPQGIEHLVRDVKAFEAADCEGPEIIDAELPIRAKLRA